ncbi:VRR-NUC domain-containing protein [Sporanaerobacter sp. PP17-6a]|uniref:VRR-NUC domain-containing protein n=1 Tax=Sporanaerobacter sp. PP17-6a TaxID=1891289 RepID=UPI0008A02A74|nr:VRR-NUC domain-containing protein [Sporanaerobacter sp. PP17-6a]SCL87964.1 VRR-NUC domain protein [Sporanaerobacter sp. PP17-6a]
MKEKEIETYLRNEIKKLGGKAYKFVSPGNNGVPDRLICLPGGQVVFVETKASGKKSTALQLKKQKELRDLGFVVYGGVAGEVDSKEKVDEIMKYCAELIIIACK